MKQILLKISTLSTALLLSLGGMNAQTVILEQNGATNDFVASQWSDMCTFCIPNTTEISIQKQESGTLNLNNVSNKYKNIEIELRFDHPLNNFAFTFDLAIKDPGNELKETNQFGDATGAVKPYAYKIVKFNNSTPYRIKKMIFSNPSKTLKINYIKITGEELASIDTEDLNSFNVNVLSESIMIDSKMDGTLQVFNALGQVEGTFDITKGENTISNSTQGLMFLVLSDTESKMVSRKKVMR